jgi:hypothetical protein
MMNNKSKHINEVEITLLIERYFEGQTTVSEEALLRRYFQQGQIADNLLIYKPLFAALADLREMPEEAHPYSRIKVKEAHNGLFWKIVVATSGIAAALLIGFFTFFYEQQNKNYVMIDGQKYTDKTLIMHNFEQSLDNVKIDMNDMLSELQTLDIEP